MNGTPASNPLSYKTFAEKRERVRERERKRKRKKKLKRE